MNDNPVRLHDPTWRQINKYRAKAAQKAGLSTIDLPTGATVITEEVLGKNWRGIRPPGADRTEVLHSPEKFLKDPKPGCKYIIRVRNDDTTFGMVESGQIRPVAHSRLRRNVKGAQGYYKYAGPEDSDGNMEYIAVGRMGLFEVNPETTREWYHEPEIYDLSLLATRKDQIEAGIREVGAMHGVKVEDVEFERKDVQTAERERMRSPSPG